MSDIDPLTSILAPNRPLPAAEIKLTWRDNTTGTKELTYGPRLPSQRGYQLQHDHGERGGVHLGMALARFSFGPAVRKRFDLDPGFPICPSAGVSFATSKAKLLASVPVRLLGGVTGVKVNLLIAPELVSSPQPIVLGLVLRPFGFVNFNDFVGSINESAFVSGHLKKLTASLSGTLGLQTVTFADLSRLGLSTQHRLAELCFFLMSDITAGNLVHVCSGTVLVSSVTNDVLPLQGSPDQEVPLAQIVAGQPLTTGLAAQAKARGNALHLSVTGATPGFISGQVQEASPWRQDLDGAHQHTGLRIVQSDGTVRSDGALLPHSLFNQGYPQVGENASDEFVDNLPCTGLKVSRSGVLGAEEVFFQELPLPAGARSLRFHFALRPETTSPVNRLALRVHLCRSNESPTDSNNALISVDGVASVDADGFVVGTVQPAETPGYQFSGARPGLGLWTQDALAAQAPNGVRLENAYRISQEITMTLSDTVRKTESYTLRYAFLVYDTQAETSLDDDAGLLWAHAYAAE